MADATRAVEEPEALTCPITHLLLRDPVVLCGSGNTYERQAIQQLIAGAQNNPARTVRDPRTNVPCYDLRLVTNHDKRRDVASWLDKHPEYTPVGWPSRELLPPAEQKGYGNGAGASAGVAAALARVDVRLVVTVACVGAACGVGWFGRDLVASEHAANAAVAHAPTFTRPDGDGDGDGAELILEARFPPQCALTDALASGLFAFFWLLFVALWTSQAHAARAPLPFMLFSLPFWGVGVMMMRESSSLVAGTCVTSHLSLSKDAKQPLGVAYVLRRTFRVADRPVPLPTRQGGFGELQVVEQATLGADGPSSGSVDGLAPHAPDDPDARPALRRWCLILTEARPDALSPVRTAFACTPNRTRLEHAALRVSSAVARHRGS